MKDHLSRFNKYFSNQFAARTNLSRGDAVHGFTQSRITRFVGLWPIYALILSCLLLLTPQAQAQQATLVYAGMAQDVPPGAQPGQLIDVGFNLNNTSGIDANNYHLQEYGTNYGAGSATYPSFSIAAGATGTAWVANFPVPAVPTTVFFVIIDGSGNPLPDLPGGKLFIDFFGGGALCEEPPGSGADTVAPLISDSDVIVQTHGGEFFIQATITDGCGISAVELELNGKIYTLLSDPANPEIYSTRISIDSNQTLDYRLIATDIVGNFGIWDPTRGYVAYSAPYGRMGLGHAGHNGGNCPPERVAKSCTSAFSRSQSTADPINTVNGNLVDKTFLLHIPGRLPINFHLTYNNQGGKETIFGLNMTHTYNYYVVEMDNQDFSGAFVQYPDGHVVVFEDFEAEPGYYETLEKTGSGFALTFPDLRKVFFTSDGDIERYEDHNGNGLNFNYGQINEYTLRSQLESIQADGGREIALSYNAEGLVESIDAPEGKTLEFDYQESAQDQDDLTPYLLTEFTDGNGNVTIFEYDDENNLIEKISPKGHPYFTNEYDDDRRVIRQSIASEFFYDFTYQVDSEDETVVSQTSTTDANGHTVAYHYADGLLRTRVDQNGNAEQYSYTQDKEVATYSDRNGNTTLYTYDNLGNTLSITDALGQVIDQQFNSTFSKPTQVVNKQADHITNYGFDAVGNLTSVTHALGDQRTLTYNALGQLIESRDFNGNATTYTYTDEGDGETTTHADGGVEQFSYDGLGRISAYTDAEGNAYFYTYDFNDNLLSVQGPLGFTLSFAYDENNHKIAFTDANTGTTDYTFDDRENNVSQSDQLGYVREFVFGSMNELTAQVDEEGVRITYAYDPAYRLIEETKAVGTADEIHMFYGLDPHGNIVSMTDAEGRITTQTFDVLHRRTAIVENTTGGPADHENNVTTRFGYSPTNQVLQTVDANDNPTDFTFDPLDRPVSIRDAESQVTSYSYDAQSNRTAMTNPRGFTTSYEHDVMNRPETITNARSGQTDFSYDLNSNRTEIQDANNIVTAFTFDELNRRTQLIKGFVGGGAPNSDTNVTTHYGYDLHGNITDITNPRGFATTFAYDPTHRTTAITDAQGHITTFDYDRVDNIISQTNRRGHAMGYVYDKLYRKVQARNEENHVEAFIYDKVDNALTYTNRRGFTYGRIFDPLNRLKRVTDPYGNTKVFEYDAMGNLLSLSDENGHIDQYVYDDIYRTTSETDAEGFTTHYGFDQNSNLIERIDAEGNATQFSFDELDRLVSVLNAENEQESYAYDELTNVTMRTQADGTDHAFTFDKLYRLAQVVNNAKGGPTNSDTNVTTRYSHDPNGNLVGHRDPNNHETTFAHDPLDRLITEVNPISSTWRYSYDPEGNITARNDANGVATTYTYFPDHQLQSVAYPDYTVDFSYNENDLPEQMQDQLGTTSWRYDKLDRLESQNDPFGRALGYGYDPVGNLLSLTYPDSRNVRHTYRKNDWLRESTTNELDRVSVQHNNVGVPVRVERSNSTTSDTVYDHVYRPLSVEDKQLNGTPITRFDYTYNLVGHITQEVAQHGWLQPNQVETNFSYDGLHRLIEERNDDDLFNTFEYDPTGNRLTQREKIQQGFTTSTYAYDSANRLLEIDTTSKHQPDNALHTFGYDENGNRIDQLIGSNGVNRGISYAYDTENRLTQHQYSLGADGSSGGVGNPDVSGTLNPVLQQAHTDLEYDGIGRRLTGTYFPGNSGGGKRTEFAFDRRDPVGEYSGWNQHQSNLYRDPQQNLLFKHALTAGDNVTSGNRFFFHHDGQGNISALTKHSGQADQSYRYEAYGTILHPSVNAALERNGDSLSQKRFDPNSELYYFGARHYDAFTGTWLTQDIYRGEINIPQSLHRYMYNYDSPVNYVDWYGYFGWKDVGNFFGGVITGIPATLSDIFLISPVYWEDKLLGKTKLGRKYGFGEFAEQYGETVDFGYEITEQAQQYVCERTSGYYDPESTASKVGEIFSPLPYVGVVGKVGGNVIIKSVPKKIKRSDVWGNPDTLSDHFLRHGRDFGATSADDYAQQAADFLQDAQKRGLPTKIDADGTIRVYDPKSNTFGAYNPDGTTKTFLKPKRGGAYWTDQPGFAPLEF